VEEGFVQEGSAEEFGADEAVRAVVGKLLQEAQDAARMDQLGEAAHEPTGRRHNPPNSPRLRAAKTASRPSMTRISITTSLSEAFALEDTERPGFR